MFACHDTWELNVISACIFDWNDSDNFYYFPGAIHYNSKNTSGDTHRVRFSNLKPDTKYRFNVFAFNKHGAGGISEEVTTRTYPSSRVPGIPRSLVAEAESDSSIRVTWAEPVTG